MAVCKGCGQEIIFIKNHKGKFIPCNMEIGYDLPFGKAVMLVQHDGNILTHTNYDEGTVMHILRGRLAHWATCPKAEEFRRQRQ
jgi:hypothetical protein